MCLVAVVPMAFLILSGAFSSGPPFLFTGVGDPNLDWLLLCTRDGVLAVDIITTKKRNRINKLGKIMKGKKSMKKDLADSKKNEVVSICCLQCAELGDLCIDYMQLPENETSNLQENTNLRYRFPGKTVLHAVNHY